MRDCGGSRPKDKHDLGGLVALGRPRHSRQLRVPDEPLDVAEENHRYGNGRNIVPSHTSRPLYNAAEYQVRHSAHAVRASSAGVGRGERARDPILEEAQTRAFDPTLCAAMPAGHAVCSPTNRRFNPSSFIAASKWVLSRSIDKWTTPGVQRGVSQREQRERDRMARQKRASTHSQPARKLSTESSAFAMALMGAPRQTAKRSVGNKPAPVAHRLTLSAHSNDPLGGILDNMTATHNDRFQAPSERVPFDAPVERAAKQQAPPMRFLAPSPPGARGAPAPRTDAHSNPRDGRVEKAVRVAKDLPVVEVGVEVVLVGERETEASVEWTLPLQRYEEGECVSVRVRVPDQPDPAPASAPEPCMRVIQLANNPATMCEPSAPVVSTQEMIANIASDLHREAAEFDVSVQANKENEQQSADDSGLVADSSPEREARIRSSSRAPVLEREQPVEKEQEQCRSLEEQTLRELDNLAPLSRAPAASTAPFPNAQPPLDAALVPVPGGLNGRIPHALYVPANVNPLSAINHFVSQFGSLPTGAMPIGAGPPVSLLTGAMPTGAAPPGSLPTGAMSIGAGPPGSLLTGAMPTGAAPPGSLLTGAVRAGALHLPQQYALPPRMGQAMHPQAFAPSSVAVQVPPPSQQDSSEASGGRHCRLCRNHGRTAPVHRWRSGEQCPFEACGCTGCVRVKNQRAYVRIRADALKAHRPQAELAALQVEIQSTAHATHPTLSAALAAHAPTVPPNEPVLPPMPAGGASPATEEARSMVVVMKRPLTPSDWAAVQQPEEEEEEEEVTFLFEKAPSPRPGPSHQSDEPPAKRSRPSVENPQMCHALTIDCSARPVSQDSAGQSYATDEDLREMVRSQHAALGWLGGNGDGVEGTSRQTRERPRCAPDTIHPAQLCRPSSAETVAMKEEPHSGANTPALLSPTPAVMLRRLPEPHDPRNAQVYLMERAMAEAAVWQRVAMSVAFGGAVSDPLFLSALCPFQAPYHGSEAAPVSSASNINNPRL